MRPRYSMQVPIFGGVHLGPHKPSEQPADPSVGYVLLAEGEPMHLAMYMKGEWRDHRNRSFRQPILCWYGLEQPDGSRLI
jgi:hypothetical protein